MNSLDDIWDEPADEVPAPSPEKRQRQALFLADSDDENTTGNTQKAPEVDIDIDAMFADVEEEDDPFTFKPLAPVLDTEALRREAESRHKNSMPTLTPHAIMSSSPPRDTGPEGTTVTGEKAKEGQKEKRKPVRLDEGRLLGPTGFPQLIKDTKSFRIKGKGHEVTDLNRLLQVYGYWSHSMFPKTTFRDTVERVEKLCHSKRMNVALSVWRDEAHGMVNGRKPEDEEVIDLTDPEGGPSNERAHASSSPPRSEAAAYASSSRPPSRPPSSGTDFDDDDDFDIDAVIRAEEERMARENAAPETTQNTTSKTSTYAVGSNKPLDEDDDADMWDELDTIQNNPAQNPVRPPRMDDDQAMWDELDAMSRDTAPPAAPPRKSRDDDEEMWDVVKEMESAEANKNAPPQLPSVPVAPTTATTAPPPEYDEDDWESMYV